MRNTENLFNESDPTIPKEVGRPGDVRKSNPVRRVLLNNWVQKTINASIGFRLVFTGDLDGLSRSDTVLCVPTAKFCRRRNALSILLKRQL